MRLVYICEAVGLHLRPFLCADDKTLVWSGLIAYLVLLLALCGECWNVVRMCFEWGLKWGRVEGCKASYFWVGITLAITTRNYKIEKEELHIWGF